MVIVIMYITLGVELADELPVDAVVIVVVVVEVVVVVVVEETTIWGLD